MSVQLSDDMLTALRTQIRSAIEATIASEAAANQAAISELETQLRKLADRKAKAMGQLVRIKEELSQIASDMAALNAQLKRFKADEAEIDRRVDAALAAMTGQKAPRSAKASGDRKSPAKDVAIRWTFDGKEFRSRDLSHVLWALKAPKKLGRFIGAKEIHDAFEAVGVRFGSSDHESRGMVAVTIDGHQIGFQLMKPEQA